MRHEQTILMSMSRQLNDATELSETRAQTQVERAALTSLSDDDTSRSHRINNTVFSKQPTRLLFLSQGQSIIHEVFDHCFKTILAFYLITWQHNLTTFFLD